MSTNIERIILADAACTDRSNTWYHCELPDKFAKHTPWICKQIKGLSDISDSYNHHALTTIVKIPWEVPSMFHRPVLREYLIERKSMLMRRTFAEMGVDVEIRSGL